MIDQKENIGKEELDNISGGKFYQNTENTENYADNRIYPVSFDEMQIQPEKANRDRVRILL